MDDSQVAATEVFFKLLFGRGTSGFVCIAVARPDLQEFKEHFFEWPTQLPEMLRLIVDVGRSANTYFCPQLLSKRKREKSTVALCPNAWSDLDTCDPSELLVDPSIIVESSPGRWQAYWVFEEPLEPAEGEAISRRIAYYHSFQGADRSGWDLTQLLRVPYTINLKPGYGGAFTKTTQVNRTRYRPADLINRYPEVKGASKEELPFPEADSLPNTTGQQLLDKYARVLPPQADVAFEGTPTDDWSKALWGLEMLAFEAGMSREEAFILARDSACNKYRRDTSDHHRADALLWREVCRAYVRHEESLDVVPPETWEMPDLLTEQERRIIAGRHTFVERYIEWAKGLGDAAPQYHEAGGLIVLSSLLSGAVRLPTSYGVIKPNLWFMILADTTLTRKSTAMDIAMELVEDLDSDLVLATDGSIEGMMTGLSTRPGQPSVFLRDEFSGLLEAMVKKDYYAGMAETLTKLYDGKMQKRVLKKETIEVKDPVFILFAGGIFNRVAGLLTREHISSGFVPRFVFITAESDVDRVKPLGPPSTRSIAGREELTDRLKEMQAHYRTTGGTFLRDGRLVIESARTWEAEMTEEAWLRYNQLEDDMMRTALRSENPDILTPTYDRLCKSMLKAAILIAASEMRKPAEEGVLVEMPDLLHAISLGEGWRVHTNNVIKNVGKGYQERELQNVYQAIKRKPGILRGSLMQTYHMTARTASTIFETLIQRGLISSQKSGKGERYYATGHAKKSAPPPQEAQQQERIVVTIPEER